MWLPILYTADGLSLEETQSPLKQGHFIEMLGQGRVAFVNEEGRMDETRSGCIKFQDSQKHFIVLEGASEKREKE